MKKKHLLGLITELIAAAAYMAFAYGAIALIARV